MAKKKVVKKVSVPAKKVNTKVVTADKIATGIKPNDLKDHADASVRKEVELHNEAIQVYYDHCKALGVVVTKDQLTESATQGGLMSAAINAVKTTLRGKTQTNEG
jgi:hypothetical protein